MMKSTVLALALVALSATATSAADTAESLQKEATACAMGFATTQTCAAGCSMQTMAAGQPQMCLPPDYTNRMLTASASGLTPVQKAAMKCTVDFQKTQQCGAGCQKVVVQGQEVCTAAGVGVDEATAAPAAETTAAPAANDATAAAAEKDADTTAAATVAATAGPFYRQSDVCNCCKLGGVLTMNGRTMCQVGQVSATGVCKGGKGPGASKYGMVCKANPPPATAATAAAATADQDHGHSDHGTHGAHEEDQSRGGLSGGLSGGPGQPAGGQSGHSESEREGSGGMFDGMPPALLKELGVGGKGDKCKGFKLFLASEAANKKCEAFDTKTACEAGGCKYEDSECEPTAATMMKVMGVEMDQEKMQAEMAAKVKGAKTQEEMTKITMDVMTKFLKPMVPVMNDMNATQVEIAKFMKRCGGGKAKAACTADKVCELQLKFNHSTDNFTQQCDVNKAKAVEETGCSGVARAIADLAAIERKAVAAGAKKALAGKKTKQKAAKDAVAAYKKANPTANAETDTRLKGLETEAAAADASVVAASATVATADADAAAAEKGADETPADSENSAAGGAGATSTAAPGDASAAAKAVAAAAAKAYADAGCDTDAAKDGCAELKKAKAAADAKVADLADGSSASGLAASIAAVLVGAIAAMSF